MSQTKLTQPSSEENSKEYLLLWTAVGEKYLLIDVTETEQEVVWSHLVGASPLHTWKKNILTFMVDVSKIEELRHYDCPVQGVGFCSEYSKFELLSFLETDFEKVVFEVFHYGNNVEYLTELFDALSTRDYHGRNLI